MSEILSNAGSFSLFNKGTNKYKKASNEGKPGIAEPSNKIIAFLSSSLVYN